jgi:hypothetical protein
VEKKLKQLKRSKAAGIDNIPPGILKDCSFVVRNPLAHIISMSLFTGEIPKEWKEAKVIPIHKKGLPMISIITGLSLYYLPSLRSLNGWFMNSLWII